MSTNNNAVSAIDTEEYWEEPVLEENTEREADNNTSIFMVIVMVLVTVSCLFYNAYHMYNWLSSMHDGLKGFLMGLGGIGLAFLEIPAAVLLVNSVRLKDFILVTVAYAMFIGAVAYMEVKAGMSSQTNIYSHRMDVMNSETQKIDALGIKIEAAKAKRDSAYAIANSYSGAMKKGMVKSADAKYLKAQAEITELRADMTANRTAAVYTDSEGKAAIDTDMIFLFPLILSMGGVIATIYTLLHVEGKMRVAAMSMANKLNQGWGSSSIEAQDHKLKVSPMGGVVRDTGLIGGAVDKVKSVIESKSVPGTKQDKPQDKTIEYHGLTISRVFRDDHTMSIAALYSDGEVMKFQGWDKKFTNTIEVPSWSERDYVTNNPKAEVTDKINYLIMRMREAKETSVNEKALAEVKKVNAVSDKSVNDSGVEPAQKVAQATSNHETKSQNKPMIGFVDTDNYDKKPPSSACKNCGIEFVHYQEKQVFCSSSDVPRKDGGNCLDDYIETPANNRPPRSQKPILNDKDSYTLDAIQKPLESTTRQVFKDSKDKSYKTSLNKTTLNDDIEQMLKREGLAKMAKVGEEFECSNCSVRVMKKHYKQKFCSHSRSPRADGGNCSNEFNNKIKLSKQ